jgi:hypothetical protein
MDPSTQRLLRLKQIVLIPPEVVKVDSRIKVLTRRITVHKSEIPSGRDTSSQATHLQLRQLIGQDLAALELCFENQKYNKTFQLEIRHVSFINSLLSISE